MYALDVLVRFLRGNGVSLTQVFPAVRGDFRDLHLRDNLLARGPGLVQFLIDFRRVDFCQQLAFRYPAANVFVPANQVAIGAGVDRRFLIGQQRSRQNQIFIGLFRRRIYHGDRGYWSPPQFPWPALARDLSGSNIVIPPAISSTSSNTPTMVNALRGGAGGSSGGRWIRGGWCRERFWIVFDLFIALGLGTDGMMLFVAVSVAGTAAHWSPVLSAAHPGVGFELDFPQSSLTPLRSTPISYQRLVPFGSPVPAWLPGGRGTWRIHWAQKTTWRR